MRDDDPLRAPIENPLNESISAFVRDTNKRRYPSQIGRQANVSSSGERKLRVFEVDEKAVVAGSPRDFGDGDLLY